MNFLRITLIAEIIKLLKRVSHQVDEQAWKFHPENIGCLPMRLGFFVKKSTDLNLKSGCVVSAMGFFFDTAPW